MSVIEGRTLPERLRSLDRTTIASIVFLLSSSIVGGSSRFNAVSNIAVGVIMTLFLLYLSLFGRVKLHRRFVPPLLVVGLWLTVMALQLVPLPPTIWAALPGHADFATTWPGSSPMGWHALAFNPPRAMSSMEPVWMALGLLVAVMGLPNADRHVISGVWLAIALLCALLGALQMVGGESSPFYFYQYTNRGYLTGLFANRNHTAAFLAAMIPLVQAWALDTRSTDHRPVRRILASAMLVLFTICILLTGSRAGLLLLGVGLIGYYAVSPVKLSLSGVTGSKRFQPFIIAIVLAGLVAAFLVNDRVNGYGRLLNFNSSAELRFLFMPELRRMMSEFFPFGSGFGSFDTIFAVIEPWTALRPTYFNNAHNDFIQTIVSGGVLLIIPAVIAAIWVSLWVWSAFRARKIDSTVRFQRAAFFGMLIILMASWVDYPLRAPLVGLLMVFLFSAGSWTVKSHKLSL